LRLQDNVVLSLGLEFDLLLDLDDLALVIAFLSLEALLILIDVSRHDFASTQIFLVLALKLLDEGLDHV